MSKKIAFIGAGSFGFTYKLVSDILLKEALFDCELSFMDIDKERLDNLKVLLDYHFERISYKKEPMYTLDMEEALKDADFIIHLTKIGGLEASEKDMDIPKKYGLYQTVGDTCGVGGVSRGLRTMVFLEKMLKMIERVSAPGAVVLNYTNPQQINVMAAAKISKVPFIGLCHSVQGTTRQMAKAISVPYEEITYEAAGINHLSFILKFEKDGEDLYPLLKARAPELYETDISTDDQIFASLGRARIDIMNRFGYMVTESSQHVGEYVPYYLRTEELRKELDIHTDIYKKNIAAKTAEFAKKVELAREKKLPMPESSVEYGAEIINAMVTDIPCKIYANVINHGLIENLPEDACVEVACMVDKNGVQPCRYGELPMQLAMLCSMEIQVHRLAVEAFLKRDSRYVYWAFLADPVANSILTPDQIRTLTEEILEAQKEYLPGFKAF